MPRPVQVYSFGDFASRTPNVPPPGDRLDAQFRAHADAIGELSRVIAELKADLAKRPAASPQETLPVNSYPGVGGPWAGDTLSATATAADWAQVAIDWAEHLPDTIPANSLAWTAVSGDHWSSRWWANRSANAFGMLAWWYQGAWPSPGPPMTPLTVTGQPIPPGAMYFNTTLGVMMVWDGHAWVNSAMPGAAQLIVGDNRIINGDIRIDQRKNGASGTAINSYIVDRWVYGATVAAKGTWGRNLNAVTGPVGFPYYLGFQSSSAYAPLAGDYFTFSQAIEADMVSDFAWGTANAQAVTLSFWARSSLTGSFGASLNNYAGNRAYPFSFSIPVANTWTRIAATIPGDTAGTWVMSGNAGSVYVQFDLGSGSTYRGSAGAWASGGAQAPTGSVSVVGTNGATFYLTGVKLEVGSVASPFPEDNLAKRMADCQRYYQKLGGSATADILVEGYATVAGTNWTTTLTYPPMRSVPTIVLGSLTTGNVTTVSPFAGVSSIGLRLVIAAIGGFSLASNTTGGSIFLSAEL